MRESGQQEQRVALGSASGVHRLAALPGRPPRAGQASLAWDRRLHVAAPTDAICKWREQLCPWDLAPALPRGLAGTLQGQRSGGLGTGFPGQPFSNGNQLMGICLSA